MRRKTVLISGITRIALIRFYSWNKSDISTGCAHCENNFFDIFRQNDLLTHDCDVTLCNAYRVLDLKETRWMEKTTENQSVKIRKSNVLTLNTRFISRVRQDFWYFLECEARMKIFKILFISNVTTLKSFIYITSIYMMHVIRFENSHVLTFSLIVYLVLRRWRSGWGDTGSGILGHKGLTRVCESPVEERLVTREV